MKVGVFDSGVGGLNVANAIKAEVPDLDVMLREDHQHVPYGTRQADEIFGFVVPYFEEMIAAGCEVIVVACNTVTTTLIDRLRERFAIPLVAIEPMVKPAAAQTNSGIIAVCATPATLASPRYNHLKTEYAANVTVLEPDCSDWSYLIEHNQMNDQKIRERIEPLLEQGADIIVLGCTHYHWIEDEIRELTAGRAEVMQPTPALIAQLKRVLAEL